MKKLVKVLFLVFAVNAFANSHSNAFNLIGTISSFFYCNKTHLSSATNTELSKQLINNFYSFAKNSPKQAQKLLVQAQQLIINSNINWESSKEVAKNTTLMAIELMKKNPNITIFTASGVFFLLFIKARRSIFHNMTKQTLTNILSGVLIVRIFQELHTIFIKNL